MRFVALRDHFHVGSDSIFFVSFRLGTSLVVWLLIGIALALPAGLFLLERNLSDVTSQWEGQPGFSLYFDPGTEIAIAQELVVNLERLEEIERVVLVTPEEALSQFRDNHNVADALNMLQENPLPPSVRAIVVNGVSGNELELIANQAGRHEMVDEIVIERTWLERLVAASVVVNRLSWILAVLFGIGAVLVTLSSVRLAIEARLEELKVQKLVGGTDAFIRRPFLYLGAIYGVGGGIVAAMLVASALLVLEKPLNALFGSYGEHLEFTGFDSIFVGALLALGGLLGISGAIVASNQRLRRLEVV
jgi:cell division transport system permease protein